MPPPPKILSDNLFPVVGVGASAGGLDAFKKFVSAIPKNSGMAYIMVQHLLPGHDSSLPQILQRETKIPVQEIKDNLEVAPDNIYVIPPNKILIATDGILQLSPRPLKGEKNMAIDIFFSSLAEVHQASSIGIIMSGTGKDGTAGLKNIKDIGGITFAQDLESAAYIDMPQNAIDAETVDFIMEPEKMPLELMKLQRTFNILNNNDESSKAKGSNEENFRSLLALIRIRTGVDFSHYKQTTIRRRILRRLGILKIEKVSGYLAYVKENKQELDLLFQDLLIPVTNFFRDTKTFENLCDTVFPKLIKNKNANNMLRIWVAGCSTGEEAYSIAICLQEYLNSSGSSIKIKIFATDISENSINKARSGKYIKRELENVSESRLQQFFTKADGAYQLKKTIRDLYVFAVHNILKDPPFAQVDFISCRNVLIYMEPDAQKKALTTFHYSLNEKGLLLLGKSETTIITQNLFLPTGKKEKLYAKKTVPGQQMHTYEHSEEFVKRKDQSFRATERVKDDFQKNADDVLLSKYTPPGVVVNKEFDILQFRGETSPFLRPSPGKASLNILKMAKAGLSFQIRNALHEAKSSGKIFIKQDIPLNRGKNLVTIEVIPLLNTPDLHFLILFRDTSITGNSKSRTAALLKDKKLSPEKNYIKNLELELAQLREDMSRITEEQADANEELQSDNEELLSSSEELQSLNEELETSQEELQSTNEELITVNQELIDRNEQLSIAKLYSEAIVNTVHEPLLVLDRDFKIKNANHSFYEMFQLSEEEAIGKIIFSLQNEGWNIPGLRKYLLNIYAEKEEMEEWEVTYIFPLAGRRTIHFNAQPLIRENNEQWLLLALDDVTAKKDIDQLNKRYSENLKKILGSMPQMISTLSVDGRVTYLNKSFLDYTGLAFEDAIDWGWERIIKPEALPELKKQLMHAIETGEDFKMEVMLKRSSDNTYRWHLTKSTPIRNEHGDITSWVGVATDIHEDKIQIDMLSEFISIATHELKTPLTTAKAYIQILQQIFINEDNENVKFVNKTAESIERLHSLILELLDITKINHGKLDLNIVAFDFNKMLQSAIDTVQFIAPSHKLIQSGKIDHPVNGDMERLRQVVINLLTNAVKYSPGKDRVQIHAAEKAGEIIVSVTDSGPGISKENINKVFEMYFRVKGGSDNLSGLGIGLSISAEIIERHKGKIWVESKPGKGSTFYFTIPA